MIFRYQIEGEDDLRKLMAMADIGDPDSSVMQVLLILGINFMRVNLVYYNVC